MNNKTNQARNLKLFGNIISVVAHAVLLTYLALIRYGNSIFSLGFIHIFARPSGAIEENRSAVIR